MTIEWHDTLTIGVIDIDIQHRLLFDKVNAFLEACGTPNNLEEINRLFWFLEAYALTHFKQEERLMQDVGFPDFLKHREKHVAFTKDVALLKERLRTEGATESLISGAKIFISDWLFDHISKMDRLIGEYVKEAES